MARRVRIDGPGALRHILRVSGYGFNKAVNRVSSTIVPSPSVEKPLESGSPKAAVAPHG